MVVVVGVGAGAGTAAAAAGGGGRGGGVGNILLVVCQSIVLFTHFTPFCVLFLVEAACFYPFLLAACLHFTSIWTGFALWNRSGGAAP